MAMAVGGKKGGATSDINVTPLIDVLLVLIIIFMVITPTISKGLNALVPQPNKDKTKVEQNNNRTIVVQVLDNNVLKINQTDITWDKLGDELSAIYKTRAEKVMFVKADNDIPFAQVARVIDITKGVDPDIRVGFLTPKIEAGQ
jgi:biopolymer transport protein TolR